MPADSQAERTLHDWLAVLFIPLSLRVDFLDKVLQSAQIAVARALESGRAAPEQIHVLVFTQGSRSARQQTWGFFRIEKDEPALTTERPPGHAVELYLYEG